MTLFDSFEPLFTPLNIGTVSVKNRIAMAPMSLDSLIPFENSYIDNRVKEYLIQRAKGYNFRLCRGRLL